MQSNLQELGATMCIGTVSDIDLQKARVRVRFPMLDQVRSAWLPILMTKTKDDKYYAMPDLGEHVVCLMDSQGEDGVMLGAIYSDADTPPVNSLNKRHILFKDGTRLEYDRAEHKLLVDCVGEITVKAATKITIESPNVIVQCETATINASSSVTATTPTFTVDGDFFVTGTATIDVDAIIGNIPFVPHKHPGVKAGPDVSAPPIP